MGYHDSDDTASTVRMTAMRHFAEYGYAGASMASIATDVGITKASLYYFFDSKATLYLAVVEQVVDEQMTLFSVDPSGHDAKRVFRQTVRHSIEHGVQYGAVLTPIDESVFSSSPQRLAEVYNRYRELQRTITRFFRRCGIAQPKFAAQLMQDANRGFIMRHNQQPTRAAITTYVRHLTNLFFT